jgi:hypothetical protein
MVTERPRHVEIAKTAYRALKNGQRPNDVAETVVATLEDVSPAGMSTFRGSLSLYLREDSSVSPGVALDVQRLLIRIGERLDWSEGVVTGLQGLMHLLIDVTGEYELAVEEFSLVEKLILRVDTPAWALLIGDVGIAHLFLGNVLEAIRCLAVPVALTGPLLDPADSARYLGNIGAWLAEEGFRYAARIAIASARERTEDADLRSKFGSDLQQLGGEG